MDYEKIQNAIDALVGFRIGIRNSIKDEYLKLAEESLRKQLPKKPIIEKWSPAFCPCCKKELSESIGDGYYKHYISKKICDCGQKLEWE
jgi:hypothetical protein